MKKTNPFISNSLTALTVFAFTVFFYFAYQDFIQINQYAARLTSGSLLWLRLALLFLFVKLLYASTARGFDIGFWIVYCFIAFFLWMLIVKWTQHLAFQTHSHDYGLFHSVLWNAAHGNSFLDAFKYEIYFADHLMFFLAALVPFYKLHPGPETLHALTAFAFLLGMIGFYRVSFVCGEKRWFAFLFAVAFGLNRYVWAAFLHEFHPDFFAPFFIFWLYQSVKKNNTIAFLIAFILTLSLKEDYALYLIPLGIFFLFSRETRVKGMQLACYSALYALIAFDVLLPSFYHTVGKGAEYGYLGSWSHLGGSFGAIAKNLVMKPALLMGHLEWSTFVKFFSRLLFLPFLNPLALIFLLPPMVLNASSAFPLIRHFSIHYGLIPVTFGFLASMEALAHFRKFLPAKVIAGVITALIIVNVPRLPFFLPAKEAKVLREEQDWIRTQAPLCVQSSLFPHLIPDGKFSIFPECAVEAKYLLLNKNAETYPLAQGEYEAVVRKVIAAGGWKPGREMEGLSFFER